jgi:hypothetical protein
MLYKCVTVRNIVDLCAWNLVKGFSKKAKRNSSIDKMIPWGQRNPQKATANNLHRYQCVSSFQIPTWKQVTKNRITTIFQSFQFRLLPLETYLEKYKNNIIVVEEVYVKLDFNLRNFVNWVFWKVLYNNYKVIKDSLG